MKAEKTLPRTRRKSGKGESRENQKHLQLSKITVNMSHSQSEKEDIIKNYFFVVISAFYIILFQNLIILIIGILFLTMIMILILIAHPIMQALHHEDDRVRCPLVGFGVLIEITTSS